MIKENPAPKVTPHPQHKLCVGSHFRGGMGKGEGVKMGIKGGEMVSENILEIEREGKGGLGGGRRRGRRPKDQKRSYELNRSQVKFYVDLSHDRSSLDLILGLLLKANSKELGRPIEFKDLVLFAITKLTDKDIEKIQDLSLTEMEKVERLLDEHNKKCGTNLTLGEFLIKRLGIN